MSFKRLSFEEGLDLFQNADLFDLQKMAVEVRNEKNPPNEVTYVIDSNPNYTNACTADCLFCAFYRKPGDDEVYVRTLDEVRQIMQDSKDLDVTTVLLQGGLHPDLKLDYYTDIIKMTVKEFFYYASHFFSAPEIDNLAEVENKDVREILQSLYDAGQRSLPGGGAEILSQKVRNRISPKKHKVDRWLHIHEVAQEIGMRSTATMMYGHREEPEDILIHLQAIRDIQDRTGGFTAFVPWTYKKDNTILGKKVMRKHSRGLLPHSCFLTPLFSITLITFRLPGLVKVKTRVSSHYLMVLMTLVVLFSKRMFTLRQAL